MVDKRVIDTIIAEAVGDGAKGMQAVAFAIANRARKSGKTPFQIVSAPSQFEGFSNPGPGVKGAINNPQIRAQVEQLWNAAENRTVPDPLKGGTMFHAKSVTPYWADEENRNGTVRIGRQTFYLGNEPAQVAAVSPAVPPRRPESPTAVAAIDSLLGTPPTPATAYAPPSGSLQAVPPPAGTPMQAVRPSLPEGSMPPAPPVPRIDEQTLRRYGENFDNWTTPRPAPGKQDRARPPVLPPSLSPPPRTVQTLPMVDMQAVAEREAAKLRTKAPTFDPVVDPKAAQLADLFRANITAPAVPGLPPRQRDLGYAPAEDFAANAIKQRWYNETGHMPERFEPAGFPAGVPPTTRLSPNGVPVYQPSLDATAAPYTPGNRPPSAPAIVPPAFPNRPPPSGQSSPPGVRTGTVPFGPPMAGVVPDRLTAQPGTGMSPKLPPVAPSRRYSMAELMGTVGPKTGLRTTAPTTFPGTTGPRVAAAPVPMPYKFPRLPKSEQIATDAGMTPPNELVRMAFSPDSQLVGNMSAGKRPIRSWLAKMFMGNPNRPQIATTRDVRPPGAQINTARDGLSGAQIDIAQRQARGNDNYQSLIEWAMRS